MKKRTLRYAAAGTVAVAAALTIAACGGSSEGGSSSIYPWLIAVTGVDSTNTYSFDLGTVDNATGRYYVTDRTAQSVDVVDIASKTLVAQFKPGFFGCALFDGITEIPTTGCNAINGIAANNDTSGPDGIDVVGANIYVGDVGALWVLDKLSGKLVTKISIPSDGGNGYKVRADEGCYDSVNNIYAISTPGDGAPFMTFIDVATNKVIYKLVMNGATGASAGLEACTYDAKTNRIYVNNDGSQGDPTDHGEMYGVPMAAMAALKGAGEVASVSATAPAGPNTNGAALWNAAPFAAGVIVPLPALCDPTGIALGKATAAGSEIGYMCRPGTLGTVMVMGAIDSATGTNLWTVNAGGGDQITYNATTDKWYLADSRQTATGTSCGAGSASCNLTPLIMEVGGTSHTVVAAMRSGNNAHSIAVGQGYIFSPFNKFVSSTAGGVGFVTPSGGGGIAMFQW